MRSSISILVLLAVGCTPPSEVTWLERFGFTWTGFNHRVSYLHWDLVEDGMDMAIIGGASSTSYVPPLPAGCEEETCSELPFEDTSSITIGWGRTTTSLATGSAEALVIATPTGGTTTIDIPLTRRGGGDVAVVLQALTVDTDHELVGGQGCYVPMLGWHPRRLALALRDPQLSDDGMSVTATLEARFEAGLSFEEYRACQDEVIDELQVPVTARVLAVVSPDGVEQRGLAHGATYAFSGNQFDPEEQPEPSLEDRALELPWDQSIAGWSSLDFRFHDDDPDLRGAYLRSLDVGFDLGEGWGSGHATNYSPGTQLSGFQYEFEGTISAVQADDSVEWGSATFDEVEAELDDDARPVIHHQGWR